MKTTARYFFSNKTEMNDWLSGTADSHKDQADIENDRDFDLYISVGETVLFYSEFNSYFADIDDKGWEEDQEFTVIV